MRTYLTLAILASTPASAMDDPATIQLLPGYEIAPGVRMAALDIHLAPGWKTYFRSPGPTGLAPRLNWSGAQGVRTLTPLWPVPGQFPSADGPVIGYRDRLLLPLRIAHEPGAHLDLTLELGLCREVCMPARRELSAALDGPDANRAEIEAALTQGLTAAPAARCALTQKGRDWQLTARLTQATPPDWSVIEAPQDRAYVTAAPPRHHDGQLTLSANIMWFADTPPRIEDFTLTLLTGTNGTTAPCA